MTARERVKPLLCRRIVITYADTDAAGIIYFAASFPWMERLHRMARRSRCPVHRSRRAVRRFCRHSGDLCEYHLVVRPYDEVEIAMSVGHLGSRSYRIDYLMTRVEDEAQVARASMTLVSIDSDGVSAPLPALITDLLTPASADADLPEESE